MYHVFLKSFRNDVADLQAAADLVHRASDLLWEAGLLNGGIPNWGGAEIVQSFEHELRGKRDISVLRWPADYAETLYYTRQSLKRAIERKKNGINNLHDWAVRFEQAVTSSDFDSGIAYHDEIKPDEIQRLRELPATAQRILKSLTMLVKRMARAQETSFNNAIPEAAEARDIETLYHASVSARQLAHSGFSATMPASDSKAGLGGSQSIGGGRKGISFTEDQYVAKEISRVFKEVAMIAQGDVSWRDVQEWIAKSGHGKHMIDWYARNYDPNRSSRAFAPVQDSDVARTPEDVMGLYLSYLNYSDRYDPKFFGVGPKGLVQRFRSLNPKNIGYIVAQVDMKNPDITYGHGEREVRIPPEAVISIDRFVG